MSEPVLALDVGGTKLAAALVDGGRVLRAARRPTPASGVWDVVAALLDEVRGTEPVAGVGIGCGGPLDRRSDTVGPLNIPEWRDGFALRARVAELMPAVPVALANDAACMALAEHRHGAGQGVADMLGVVVSTGVGGGLIADGRVVPGRTGNAGHVGHVVVEPEGPACGCGGRGCLEAVAAGPRLVAWARERGWSGHDGFALLASAHQGDPVALQAFRRAGLALGRGLASVAAVCDLDLIVLAGGLANAGPLLFDPAREALGTHAGLDFLRGLRVVPAALGEHAGVVGAAALIGG